jgi:hypothetical protein
MDISNIMGGSWSLRFRELEHFVRRGLRISREDPEDELPHAELSGGEQQAALRREAARRVTERP